MAITPSANQFAGQDVHMSSVTCSILLLHVEVCIRRCGYGRGSTCTNLGDRCCASSYLKSHLFLPIRALSPFAFFYANRTRWIVMDHLSGPVIGGFLNDFSFKPHSETVNIRDCQFPEQLSSLFSHSLLSILQYDPIHI